MCILFDRCEDKGLVEIKPGTQYFDVECGNKSSSSVIIGVTVLAVLLAVAATALFIFLKKKHKTGHNAGKSSVFVCSEIKCFKCSLVYKC